MKGQLNSDGYVMDFGDVKNVHEIVLFHSSTRVRNAKSSTKSSFCQ